MMPAWNDTFEDEYLAKFLPRVTMKTFPRRTVQSARVCRRDWLGYPELSCASTRGDGARVPLNWYPDTPEGDELGHSEAIGLGYQDDGLGSYKMTGSGTQGWLGCRAVSESQKLPKRRRLRKSCFGGKLQTSYSSEASLEVAAGVEATNEARDMASIAKAKGKRPRGDSSGGRRKEKRSRNEAPIYKDKMASANLIASCSGPTLAAPRPCWRPRFTVETAAGFLKAFNSMNSMVRSYDSANRKCEISRAEADAKIAEANAKVAEADAKVAEADAKVAEAAARVAEADEAKQGAEALAKAEKVERLKMAEDGLRLRSKFEAEIERLNRLFTEEKSLREKEARANAELIADLEGGKKVEEEKEEILQWKAEYGDAEDEFVRLGTELREGLKLPPASPDSVDDSFGNRSIEGVAAGVGILDQAGTNLGPEAARVPEEQDE
ncbi:hypothetical protein ISN45_Aa01g026850 [Arabidopsis thaliana x Arabidopsis arenosa]|uniref:Uncharacterized protein n=1 Tax=Arabidopsis thaliana x Arabidopsis arenosa TaxID=1240361 RepID=A0A8T2C1G9_9BRAS|nr:hypothetical protein ISN45_Aa01g026850 [Arabidopsis thaliana x Arabidopsis arenosa]